MPGGYQNTFNDNMLVVVMLETLDGILNADEIAQHVRHRRGHPGQQRPRRASRDGRRTIRATNALLTVSRNATLQAGKFWGNAGAQYLTGHPLSADVRLIQNGPSIDGWTPPARNRSTSEEPTIGVSPQRPRNGSGGMEDNSLVRAAPVARRHSRRGITFVKT